MPPKEKKEEKKEGGLPSHGEAIGEMVVALLILVMIGKLADRVSAILSGQPLNSPLFLAFLRFYDSYKAFAVLITAILICIVIPLVQKITAIRTEERKILYPDTKTEAGVPGRAQTNPRWQKVIDHLETDRPNDWKLSILEADIMLADLLEASGYEGETIGEKLKTVERSDFNTIDLAWEAHKVRNMIAHEGTDYQLSQREAIRIVELYKKVFEEFYYI